MSDPKFKPLLAAPVEFDKLDYTNLWGSPKLDGIRCMIREGITVSRSLKTIPNKHVQSMFGDDVSLEGLDGELIVGSPTAKDVYRVTDSGVMSIKGEPDVKLYVFDHTSNPNEDYFRRYDRVRAAVSADSNMLYSKLVLVEQKPITSYEALLELEAYYLELGYEGMMLRAFQGPSSWYKFGRSTPKQGTLLKVKRFTDSEAFVRGFEELMKNGNEATKNELGHTERSSHAENLIPMGTLGALVCETREGIPFKIGTGFDVATRQKIWDNRDDWLGTLVKFKSFDIGVKTAPRFPVFLGQRADIDL